MHIDGVQKHMKTYLNAYKTVMTASIALLLSPKSYGNNNNLIRIDDVIGYDVTCDIDDVINYVINSWIIQDDW